MRRTKVNVSGYLGRDYKHVGEIVMPLNRGGCVHVKTLGWSPWSAIKKAVLVANDIARNPAVAQFLPPQVNEAIVAANVIASMSKEALQKLKDHPKATPAQKSLAAKLLESPEMQAQATPTTAGFSRAPRLSKRKRKTYHVPKPPPPPPPPPEDDDGGDDDGGDSVQDVHFVESQEEVDEMQMSDSAMATEAWGPDSNEEQAKAAWGPHAFAPGSFDS